MIVSFLTVGSIEMGDEWQVRRLSAFKARYVCVDLRTALFHFISLVDT